MPDAHTNERRDTDQCSRDAFRAENGVAEGFCAENGVAEGRRRTGHVDGEGETLGRNPSQRQRRRAPAHETKHAAPFWC